MLKPPSSNIPGMTDTLEFVKNLWGNMNIPGAMPGMGGAAVSTDELDKKIADMKAVEAWLNMNLSMLRGTIQALEVQRNTIATLKSMGESMAQAMGQGADKAAPFAQFFAQAAQAAPAPQPEAAPPEQPASTSHAEPPPAAASMPAAVAWWNLLQDQFTQAVTSAMSPEAMAGAAAMAQDAAKRFAEAATPPAGKPEAPSGNDGNAGGGSTQPGTPSKPRAARSRPEKA